MASYRILFLFDITSHVLEMVSFRILIVIDITRHLWDMASYRILFLYSITSSNLTSLDILHIGQNACGTCRVETPVRFDYFFTLPVFN